MLTIICCFYIYIFIKEKHLNNNNNINNEYKYPLNAYHCTNHISLDDYEKIVQDTEECINELEKEYLRTRSDEDKQRDFMNHKFVLYELSK